MSRRRRALWLVAFFWATLGAAAEASPSARRPLAKWDPIEPANRRIYHFNVWLDRRILLPALDIYQRVPQPPRTGVKNFFANLEELPTLVNSLLQGSPEKVATTAARFAVNSTVGVGGLFDVATRLGLRRYSEDLGQTLGRYGFGAGPYLVLPLFGPSSLRDSFGLVGDRSLRWLVGVVTVDDLNTAFSVSSPLEAVSRRDSTDFRYAELGPFEYELVRYTFLEYRAALVGE